MTTVLEYDDNKHKKNPVVLFVCSRYRMCIHLKRMDFENIQLQSFVSFKK